MVVNDWYRRMGYLSPAAGALSLRRFSSSLRAVSRSLEIRNFTQGRRRKQRICACMHRPEKASDVHRGAAGADLQERKPASPASSSASPYLTRRLNIICVTVPGYLWRLKSDGLRCSISAVICFKARGPAASLSNSRQASVSPRVRRLVTTGAESMCCSSWPTTPGPKTSAKPETVFLISPILRAMAACSVRSTCSSC